MGDMTFITPTFYSDNEKYAKKFDDIIKKAKKKESEDTGERTLFIKGDKQRESLKSLQEMFVSLSPSPAGSRVEVWNWDKPWHETTRPIFTRITIAGSDNNMNNDNNAYDG